MHERHKISASIYSFLIAFSFGLVGCASSGDLVATRRISIQSQGTRRLEFSHPIVREERGMLVVSGRVSQVPPLAPPVTGHVHAELIDLEGRISQSGYGYWSPPLLASRPGTPRPNSASYVIKLTGPAPAGARIRLSVAYDSHTENG